MHPNPAFRQEPEFLHLNMVRLRGFGALIVPDGGLPMVSHVPFVLDEGDRTLELHLMRSNPICGAVRFAQPAMMVVNGPDGYVSPDWYGDPDNAQVPTWNYVAVHLTGRIEPMADQELRAHLDRLAETFEARLVPKKPWETSKMPPQKMEAMMLGIRAFRFRIETIDGTWKLNQNKSDAQRERAASHMRHGVTGHETEALSRIMRGLGPQTDED